MVVKIEKLDNLGRGICYIDNKICFIEKALPEDELEIKITKEKSKYLEGEIVKIINASPIRKESTCPYFNTCGGCQYLNIDYKDEIKVKNNSFKEIIQKYAGINSNIIKDINSIDKNNYRNKVTFHVKDRILGFYKYNSNELIEIDCCLLLDEEINKVIPVLKEYVKSEQVEIIIIKCSNDSKEKMIELFGNINNTKSLEKYFDVIVVNNNEITSENYINTKILDINYSLKKDAFFQVNKYLTNKLYMNVIDYLKKVKAKNVLDLYCGVGAISLAISKYVDKVIGIEINEAAIKSAKITAKNNNISNVEFICNSVEKEKEIFNNIDTVIVDPPRSGLNKTLINSILKNNIKNLIYISCNPITLARDLKLLEEEYKATEIVPYNMFLHTYHLESITVLERK